jgi:hypothetical protein
MASRDNPIVFVGVSAQSHRLAPRPVGEDAGNHGPSGREAQTARVSGGGQPRDRGHGTVTMYPPW